MRAARAGVRSIEHGSLIDDEAIDLVVEQGTYLVADMSDGDWMDELGPALGYSDEVMRKDEETNDAQREGFAKAVEAGCAIAYGTDTGIAPHGIVNARQFAYYVRYGMTPMQAIQSATRVAAELIGWQDRVGAIAPGLFADLIAVPGDPTDDSRCSSRCLRDEGRRGRSPAVRAILGSVDSRQDEHLPRASGRPGARADDGLRRDRRRRRAQRAGRGLLPRPRRAPGAGSSSVGRLVGGACNTEEFAPGFRRRPAPTCCRCCGSRSGATCGSCSAGSGSTPPAPRSTCTPTARSYYLGDDMAANVEETRRFSRRDARALPRFEEDLGRARAGGAPVFDWTAPDPRVRRAHDLGELARGDASALRHRQRPRWTSPSCSRRRATQFLAERFETDHVKAALGWHAINDSVAGPSTPGHRVRAAARPRERGDRRRRAQWGFVRGGMGRLTETMADAAREAGAEIRCDAEVERGRHARRPGDGRAARGR